MIRNATGVRGLGCAGSDEASAIGRGGSGAGAAAQALPVLTLSAGRGRAPEAAADAVRSAGLACAAACDVDALCRAIAAEVAEPLTARAVGGREAGQEEAERQETAGARGVGAIVVDEEALAGDDAAALARMLASQPAWSDVTVVVLLRGEEASPDLDPLRGAMLLPRGAAPAALGPALRIALRDRARQYALRAQAGAIESKDALVSQVAHRAKNTLAVIQAMIAETRRQAASLDDFASAMEGRLRALAVSQDVLHSQRWQGGDLATLIEEVLAPFVRPERERRLRLGGPQVMLDAEATQTLAMIFHELASNAAGHGALSSEAGAVEMRWAVVDGELRIDWQERAGPPVTPPARRGYGSSIIEQLAPYQLGGASTIEYDPDGVRCHLTIPAARNLAGPPR